MIALRRGVTRTVLLIGRWAVKVPSLRACGGGLRGRMWGFSRGVQANLSEQEWCRHLNDAPEPLVCPVRWSLLGGIVNIYPRCDPVPCGPDGEPLIALPPLDMLPLGDAKPSNFGVLNGQPVWIDYDVSYNGCQHDRGGVAGKLRDFAAARD